MSLLDSDIENDGFWPDVPVRRFVDNWRVPVDNREGLVIELLTQAVIDTNTILQDAKTSLIHQGYHLLEDWIDDREPFTVNGNAVAETCYQQAVYHLAKAASIPLFNSAVRKPITDTESKAGETTVADFQDLHARAVNRLLTLLGVETSTANFGVYAASL